MGTLQTQGERLISFPDVVFHFGCTVNLSSVPLVFQRTHLGELAAMLVAV